MKLVDILLHGMTSEEEQARAKAKSLRALVKSFREETKKAKVLRENALKLKALRVKLFGEYITRYDAFHPFVFNGGFHPTLLFLLTASFLETV